jgi:cytoskeletal protein RodZ
MRDHTQRSSRSTTPKLLLFGVLLLARTVSGSLGLWLNIFGANFQNAKKSTQQPNHTDDRRQSNKDDNIPNAHKLG